MMKIRTALNYNLKCLYDHLAVEAVKMLAADSTLTTKYAFFTFAMLTVTPGSESVLEIVNRAIEFDCIGHAVDIIALSGQNVDIRQFPRDLSLDLLVAKRKLIISP